MGEFASYKGESVKIGTCENMYYLRADQVGLVIREKNSLDPADKETQAQLRFRFPWPDEDGTEPGGDGFQPYERAVVVHGMQPPPRIEHNNVQFLAPGYVASLPCPEGPFQDGYRVHRNGFPGAVKIAWQGYRGLEPRRLAVICQCGGCGALYSLSKAEAEPLIVACRAEADRGQGYGPEWWHAVADRIAAGYEQEQQ